MESKSLTIKKSVLDNGLTLMVLQVPESNIARVEYWVKAGSRFEEDGERGAAHMLEHVLLKGTKILSREAFRKKLNELGAKSNATTMKEGVVFYIEAPARNLRSIIALLADVVCELTIPEEVLKNEKRVVTEEYYMSIDNTMGRVLTQYHPIFFGNHPLGKLPMATPQETATLTMDCLARFHTKYYLPSRSCLVVSSSEQSNILEELVRTSWEAWSSESVPFVDGVSEFTPLVVHELSYSANSPYGGYIARYRIPQGISPEERAMFSVLHYHIGGGKYNVLIAKLRDELGIAYAPRAFLKTLTDAVDFGMEARTTDIARAKTAIDRILQSPISGEEIDRAKQGLLSQIELMQNDFRGLMDFTGSEFILGKQGYDDIAQWTALIEKVSLDDLRRIVTRYLVPENLLEITIEPSRI